MDATGTSGSRGSAGCHGGRAGRPAAITYRATDDATGRQRRRQGAARATPRPRCGPASTTTRPASSSCAEHPDIVATLRPRLHAGNQPYVVMEELERRLDGRQGRLRASTGPGVLALGVQVAGALESAHRRNLVHGDLRPEDVLVTDDGEPAHRRPRRRPGHRRTAPTGPPTPARLAHAAPEQLETHVPTPASDVYGLGSVLYALLAGSPGVRPARRHLRRRPSALRIAREPAPDLRPTGVPDPVVDVIERAMAEGPGRPLGQSAEAFGLALQQAEVTLGLPITPMTVLGTDLIAGPARGGGRTRPRPWPGRSRPRARCSGTGRSRLLAPSPPVEAPRRACLIVAAILAVLALGGGAFVVLGGGDDGRRAERRRLRTRRRRRRRGRGRGDDDHHRGHRRPGGRPGCGRPDATGTITLSRLARWDQENGASIDAEGVVGTRPDRRRRLLRRVQR